MRIYYFGELIEDTNAKKEETKKQQTQLALEEPRQKVGMPSLGDILQEIDLSLDAYHKNNLQRI